MPIPEVKKIWMDGEFVDWKEAKVHVLTHALHYGSGVFEGIRCYHTKKGPAVFRFKEHLERLYDSADLYHIDIPFTLEELREATKELIKINGLDACYIRPIAFRGYGEMGLNPLNSVVNVSIAVWPWGAYLGEEGIKNGIRCNISTFERISPKALPPYAKCTGPYVNSILAKVESLKSGYDEAIMLDYRGLVSEGPGENIFAVKNGSISTTPEHASILRGITRASVMDIAGDLGHPVDERDITRDKLLASDEVFFTGTAAEITPIREIDGVEIGKPGPMTKEIQDVFFKTIRGDEPKYEKWLDYVRPPLRRN
jgi:branched-chain amino acid aminotransferase